MIDFHSHVLPGIDDGSRDTDMSLEMLNQERGQGVDTVVATPHFYADRDSVKAFLERREQSMEQLAEAAEQKKQELPRICTGAEVAYFRGIGQAGLVQALCIQPTRVVLVEMPFCQWDSSVYDDIQKLYEKQNLIPVLAHIERYYDFQRDRSIWSEVMDLPLHSQMNAGPFLDWRKRRKCLRILRDRGTVLLGSDAHNLTSRKPNLQPGCEVIREKLGSEYLARTQALEEELLGT